MVVAGYASVRPAQAAIKDIPLGMSMLSASPSIMVDTNAETSQTNNLNLGEGGGSMGDWSPSVITL
ncbi:hypothetical protein EG328_004311 [Venturia inaequalis]|uniref:Uncharacterized protein n=1 Tax=Venturia inaequalis TaxID=5025 RepID=A0A8H3YXR4_VENIN|nr:hypothetical protein EG328_004311 [Venturia inaequalis]KAE9986337.1 hypothetical protein EG327_004384 [Venturia inaequalis]